MRTPRIILDDGACAYHLVSRVTDKQYLFDTDVRKKRICEIISASASLHGVEILNYVVMSNHYHILARVPKQDFIERLNEKSLIQAATTLYSQYYVTDLKRQFASVKKLADPLSRKTHRQDILNRYEDRRGNLSEFMKEVNQRISCYINKEHKRKGTLWEERFKSPIVENTLAALLAVSTYIDLNPIRAGIVDRPEEYRWCGYSAALAGNQDARRGLCSIYEIAEDRPTTSTKWADINAQYRQYLFEKGIEVLNDETRCKKARRGFTVEEVEREIKRNGKLPLHKVICHRIRYFSDGAVIGSAAFVDEVFKQQRSRLVSPDSKRRTGARAMRCAEWGELTALRDLRVNVIGLPSS